MGIDEKIMYDVNNLYFDVNLISGAVTYIHNTKVGVPNNKLCRNVQEANLYSLNILRQNVAEEEFKTGKKPESIIRYFLGTQQIIDPSTIIPTMKWLQNTFPEKII